MTLRGSQTAVRAGFVALLLISAAMMVFGTQRVEATAGVNLQATDDDLYPIATLQDNFSYPIETEIPSDQPPESTNTPDLVISPTLTPTPGASPTPVPDVFGTEDAQMGDSLVTPPSSPTPGSSITPVNTPTMMFTPTGTVVAMLENRSRKEGFQVDWGFFMIGFVIPVLVGCGLVLYLLDRRPDLFSQRH